MEVIVSTMHLLNITYTINLDDIDYIKDVLDGLSRDKMRKASEGCSYEHGKKQIPHN